MKYKQNTYTTQKKNERRHLLFPVYFVGFVVFRGLVCISKYFHVLEFFTG